MAELVFPKVKGVQKESVTVDIESYIAIKGFKALGNQLTTDKLKQVNLLEPLHYELPVEVVPEKVKLDENLDESGVQLDDDGQVTLSLE